MHTLWNRANAVFAFTLSVLAAATFAAFLSTILVDYVAPVQIAVINPRVKAVHDYTSERGGADYAMLQMDINVDVSPVFNWNVKQLFIYLVAEYSSAENVLNQVVLWDKIVMADSKTTVRQESILPKYHFIDDGHNLRSHQNVTLELRWNVVPNAGYLRLAQGEGSTKVEFPSEYITGRRF